MRFYLHAQVPLLIAEEIVMKTDVHLQRDVLDELDWEPSIDAAQIGVTAKEGVVTLTGHVAVFAEKHLAEEVAKRVHGVRAVANEIEVRPSDVHVRDDEELALAVLHALAWDAKVPHEHLKTTVENSWIRVEGTVDEPYQKAAVDRAVRHLVGARGMTNAIQVAPREVVSEVKARVEAAFLRSASLDSSKLDVQIDGQTLILSGDVHSRSEFEEAERIAWSARGVNRVENCITITPWGRGPAEEWGY
jgi:osmotically-inducible protein OsmY